MEYARTSSVRSTASGGLPPDAKPGIEPIGVQITICQPILDGLSILSGEHRSNRNRRTARLPSGVAGLNQEITTAVVRRTRLAARRTKQATGADEHALRALPDDGGQPCHEIQTRLVRTTRTRPADHHGKWLVGH
ncbi:hypothetical protein [Actinomadura sp. 6N118]|uniref:hypothetical protein n=1 Tax=Actinomadura sp. 6N118 TaxID=3375151 RepID=UPI0037A26886